MGNNAKKDRIMDIAKSRFEQYGFKKTNTNEICKDAHISKKTLYIYFKNKEDIFESIFIREILKARKTALANVPSAIDPVEKLEQLARIAIEYVKTEPFLKIILQHESDLYAPHQKEKFVTLVETEMVGIIADILEDGIVQGQLRKIDTKIVAYLTFKLFQAISYGKTSTLSNGDITDYEIKQVYDLIRRGIKNVG